MWNGESFWSLIFKECRCSKTSRVLYCIVDVVITLRGLIDYKPQPKNMTPTLCIYWVDVVLGSNKSSSRLSDLHSDLHKFGSKKRMQAKMERLAKSTNHPFVIMATRQAPVFFLVDIYVQLVCFAFQKSSPTESLWCQEVFNAFEECAETPKSKSQSLFQNPRIGESPELRHFIVPFWTEGMLDGNLPNQQPKHTPPILYRIFCCNSTFSWQVQEAGPGYFHDLFTDHWTCTSMYTGQAVWVPNAEPAGYTKKRYSKISVGNTKLRSTLARWFPNIQVSFGMYIAQIVHSLTHTWGNDPI